MFIRGSCCRLFGCQIATVVLLLALAARGVHAHRPKIRRQVLLQIDDQGLAWWWRVQGGGVRVALMRRLHDLDGNGTLSPPETEVFATAILNQALHGYRLTCNGAPLAVATFTPRLLTGARGGQVIAEGLLQQPTADLGMEVADVVLRALPGTQPLAVTAQGLGWTISEAFRSDGERCLLATGSSALAAPCDVGDGASLRLRFRRVVASGKPRAFLR